MDFSWAEEYPDIHKICTLFDMRELTNPKRFVYKPLQSYLQEGPQCGLVALGMCTGQTDKATIKHLYDTAKNMQITHNGEIFSCSYMAKLAATVLNNPEPNAVISLFRGHLNCEEIKEFLFEGGLILVPFDSDVTNRPGLYNGHKAHWAVLSGAIETNNGIFVFGRHGKARNVGIWTLEELAESNAQLNEFSPDRKSSNLTYQLPEGGINGPEGLKTMCVLIKFKL